MEQCRQGKSAKRIRNFGKGLALRTGHGGPSPEPVGCRRTARAAHAARAGRRVPAGGRTGNGPPRGGPSPGVEQSTQNWYGQGESDCLIKTKHCDGPCGCSRNVISAQCSECQSEEIQPSAGKRRE
ncbi:uncharacterized protein M6B38_120140 [Iris pallida]|uniref:Uncharacterized protein n=1 Tax=Iris pallida TaxID=29817 RepID=A0AAX6HAH8_IRIPA|nr:uncharacterized protein M6B38_105085 [Iris pallida]KAJ6837658.1 uncharacterized protein M6B38_120140 [Iris pallida]